MLIIGFTCGMCYAKELVIIGHDYPPVITKENGMVKGALYDVALEACKKLDYKCTFEVHPVARALKELEEGRADMVLSLIPNPEREVYANLSQPLIVNELAFLKLKGAPRINDVTALEGWEIGTVRASSSAKILRQRTANVAQLTITEEVSNEVLIKKLQGVRYGGGAKGAIF